MSPSVKPNHEPITAYVVLEVRSMYPFPHGAAQMCARRLSSHPDILDVRALVDEPTLSDVMAKVEALP